jgi:hypothetical protein
MMPGTGQPVQVSLNRAFNKTENREGAKEA